jgi:transposase-like protein
MSGWRLGIDCPYCGLQSPMEVLDGSDDTVMEVSCSGCKKTYHYMHRTKVISYTKKMRQGKKSDTEKIREAGYPDTAKLMVVGMQSLLRKSELH